MYVVIRACIILALYLFYDSGGAKKKPQKTGIHGYIQPSQISIEWYKEICDITGNDATSLIEYGERGNEACLKEKKNTHLYTNKLNQWLTNSIGAFGVQS